jgi:hypothetical protein
MGKRDLMKGGLPLCIGIGAPRQLPPLSPEREAEIQAQAERLRQLEDDAGLWINGEFVEPEDDPDGFDRRMTGV